jgi:membrane-associated protein
MSGLLDALVSFPPWLLLLLVFLLPALEASAFVGLVFPGETAVVVGGVAAEAGRVSLVLVVVLAIAGAIAGDQIGFHIGRRWGPGLVARVPDGTRRARSVEASLAFVRRRGPLAVTLGRWTASLRSLVPGIAGMSGMGQRSFTVANGIGGVVWATVVAVAGYLAGASYKVLEHRLGLAADVALGVLAVGLVAWAVRQWVRHRREDRITS